MSRYVVYAYWISNFSRVLSGCLIERLPSNQTTSIVQVCCRLKQLNNQSALLGKNNIYRINITYTKLREAGVCGIKQNVL